MKIVGGIFSWPELKHPQLEERLIELTGMEMNQGGITYQYSKDIRDLFEYDDTADFLLLQTPGHIFFDLHINLIKELAENCDSMICHLIDGLAPTQKGRFNGTWIWPEVILVNLNTWRSIGRPDFGNENEIAEVIIPDRSVENIHDDYTPLWVRASSNRSVGKQGIGWNLINQFLEHGYEIQNWDKDLRRKKDYFYPTESNAEELWKTIRVIPPMEESKSPRVNSICERLTSITYNDLYCVNTEPLRLQDSIPGGIKQLVAVSSGFMSNFLLDVGGFTSDTKVVLYDINPNSLAWKKSCIENWDGEDLPSFYKFQKEANKVQGNPVGLQEWDVDVLKHFKTKECWLEHWSKFKKLDFKYVVCDITKDPNPLSINNDPSTVVWFSNIFRYRPYVRSNGWEIREEDFRRLSDASSSCKMIGQGPRRYI